MARTLSIAAAAFLFITLGGYLWRGYAWGGYAATLNERFLDREAAEMATSRIRKIDLERQSISPGESQILYTSLHNPSGELMILTLSISYPDGQKQTVVESSLTDTGTLSWTIPTTVPTGVANYRLTAGGCGCGAGNYGMHQPALESSAEGVFWVE